MSGAALTRERGGARRGGPGGSAQLTPRPEQRDWDALERGANVLLGTLLRLADAEG